MKTFAAIGKLLALGTLIPLLAVGTVHADTTTGGENGLIAYTKNIQGKSSLWIVKADGTKPKLVANDSAQNPVWAPDGRTLAFTAGGTAICNTRVVIMAANSMRQKTLAQDGCFDTPSWSKDSTSLVFSQTKKEAHRTKSALFAVHTNTRHKTTIAGWSTKVMFRSPSWAPDGNRIVFEQYDKSGGSLYIADLALRSTSLLTNLSDVTNSSQATWSPSGKKIAYADSSNEVYIIWPDGSHRAVISDGDSYDAAWSPDGRELLFLEDHSGEALSLSQSDGTVVQLPLSLQGYVSIKKPIWSPDGTKALFIASTEQGKQDLLSINLKTSLTQPHVLARNVSGGASWQTR